MGLFSSNNDRDYVQEHKEAVAAAEWGYKHGFDRYAESRECEAFTIEREWRESQAGGTQ
ncbi:hypothetical protein [Streptomyces griseorubiginosus]|uniref:hypothetical protein n=1 Tax=Streptomyces griseorubiginosus TaxID=67304 RepID=UPI0036E1FFBF